MQCHYFKATVICLWLTYYETPSLYVLAQCFSILIIEGRLIDEMVGPGTEGLAMSETSGPQN